MGGSNVFHVEEYLQNMLHAKNLSWTARIMFNGHACFNSIEEFLTQINTNRQKAQKYSQPKMNETPWNKITCRAFLPLKSGDEFEPIEC